LFPQPVNVGFGCAPWQGGASGLLRAELATAACETMKTGAKPVEVIRLQITAAGRKAIEE